MARELAPAGVRSAPTIFGAAAQPSGSKLPRHTLSFRSVTPGSHAAIEGQGIALGRSVMVRDDLASGRLIRPFGEVKSAVALAYDIVFRPESSGLAKVQVFRNWLLTQAAT
ncbi:LysR substrate-binding domain-containing protein [Pseudomonas sp. MWU16-30323]|uniref:LysR substrate-binding domain-containing protein n=1 Tax=Pseudomonas sp. MWU16-30323 TaxID=2878094 RepID=UPI0031FC539C